MLKSLLPLTLALLMTTAGMTVAQETPAPETAPETATETPADPNALDLGTPVTDTGEPQVGQPYIRDTYGDWSMRCVKSDTGSDPCQLYQLLNDADGNPVVEFTMFPLPPGQEAAAGANIVAPLETYLPAKLTIKVDGNEPRVYDFTFCNRAGCVARVGFTQAMIDQFKGGANGTVTIVPAANPETRVDLAVSLSGFTAAITAAEAAAPAGQ